MKIKNLISEEKNTTDNEEITNNEIKNLIFTENTQNRRFQKLFLV